MAAKKKKTSTKKKRSLKDFFAKRKTRNGIIGGALAAVILGGIGLHKKNDTGIDDMLTANSNKLYLVDVDDSNRDIYINDYNGNKIKYDFDKNVLAVVGTNYGNTFGKKMYEVMLIDGDNKITYGQMEGRFLSNSKMDCIKVINSDFKKCSSKENVRLYNNCYLDSETTSIDSNNFIASKTAFYAAGSDCLWNEAIAVKDGRFEHGYITGDSISFKEDTIEQLYYVSVSSLNVRSSASTAGNVIGQLGKNDVVKICDDYDAFEDGTYRWIYVSFENGDGSVGTGWIAAVDYSSGNAVSFISDHMNETVLSNDDILAESAVLYDVTDDNVMFDKCANQSMRPASITKIFTAYLVSKYGNLNDKLTYSSSAINVEGHAAEEYGTTRNSAVYHVVKKGTTISVKDALNISLLLSDNATTVALKEYVESITKKDFETLMNETAKELGCRNSNFTNAYGYEDDNHLVSPYDMAMIASAIYREEPEVLKIMGTASYELEYDGTVIYHQSPFINASIDASDYHTLNAIGCKTGWTNVSGQTMVTLFEKDDHVFVVVTMKSKGTNSKNVDAKTLANYAFEQLKKSNNKVLTKKNS